MMLEIWSLEFEDLVPVVKCLVRLSCSLATLVIGLEDWIWVLIASVPGLCILSTFKSLSKDASLVMRKPAYFIYAKTKAQVSLPQS